MLGDESKSYSDWFSIAKVQGWTPSTFKRRLNELKDGKIILQSKLDRSYSRKKAF